MTDFQPSPGLFPPETEHDHDGINSRRISYNSLLDKPTQTSSAWSLVSFSTAAAADITISGLDLSTDRQYQIIVQLHNNAVATGKVNVQVNADATAGAHTWVLQKAYLFTTPTNGADGSLSDTKWELTESMCSHAVTLYLGLNENMQIGWWTGMASGLTTGVNNAMAAIQGSGFYFSNNNITSLKFSKVGGSVNDGWAVWVFKAATS
jgi:hypothetical protein